MPGSNASMDPSWSMYVPGGRHIRHDHSTVSLSGNGLNSMTVLLVIGSLKDFIRVFRYFPFPTSEMYGCMNGYMNGHYLA